MIKYAKPILSRGKLKQYKSKNFIKTSLFKMLHLSLTINLRFKRNKQLIETQKKQIKD